jgi:hypothetical protein
VYKKKTLRTMMPATRQYARILNDLDSVLRRLKNLREAIASLELDSRALHAQQQYHEARRKSDDAELAKRIDAAEVFYDPALKDVDPEILFGPAPEDLLRQQQEATDEL